MRLQSDMGREPVSALVVKLAVPTMVAQFVSVLYSIVDRMYIGNIPLVGDIALAGVGVCGPVVTLLSSFGTLVGLGGAPIMAMRLGQGNHRGARLILANAFVMLCTLGVALSALFFVFKRPLLLFFGASAATLEHADAYMTIYAAGTIFALLASGLNSFIICQGFSSLAMVTVLIGAALNIALDPIFIFGLGMGVRGAAVATVISQAASCAFVLVVLLAKKTPVRISIGRCDRQTVFNILKFGFCPFIIIATDSVLLIVMNMALKRYGGAQADLMIACATIVQSFLLMVSMPLGGITGGCQPILSFNYGAQRTDRIRAGVKWILVLAVAFDTTMMVISRIAAEAFASIFTSDTQTIQLSVWGIHVITAAIIPMAVQYTLVDSLTALGVTRVAVSLSIFRKSLYFITTLIAPRWYGAPAAFFAEPIADSVACCVTVFVFYFVFRKTMAERDAMPAGSELFGG